MLVDAVLMRREGAKLSRDDLARAPRVRGHLSIRKVPWREIWASERRVRADAIRRPASK